jgi:hypothetical protein
MGSQDKKATSRPSLHYSGILLKDPTPSPSTPEPEVMDINEERLDHDDGPDWHIPYLARLVQGVLPLDQMQARWLARRAKSFVLLDRELYKRSASRILQRCIPTNEGRQLL